MIGWNIRISSDVGWRLEVMAVGRRRILVVEDDLETAEQVVESLATNGYQVDLAVNGNDGLSRGRSADYAVMTIDRMLPGMDGISVIRSLREDGIVTPVLIISALGEIDDRVRGLRAGGDDYLVKPFAFAELLARVEALARRSVTVVKETVLRVGDLELDLVSRAVSRCGRTIELLPREFQVLEYLVRNEGQVVPRAMLLQHVWDLHFDPTTTTSVAMSDASAARSTASKPTRSSTPFAASGSASGLLAKTFRSSTLRLALICIAIFGAAVFALFSYVYWSTASYVRSRSDQTIAAELSVLQQVYAEAGRDGLIAAIAERVGDAHFEGSLYLLADAAFAPVAGNLKIWPSALSDIDGRSDHGIQDWQPDADRPLLRTKLATLPDGYHLLVAKNIDDLDAFAGKIKMALAATIALTFLLGGLASGFRTRRTVGRIEAINATSRAIMQSGLSQRIPLRGTRDEWDQLAENLNLMLD